MSEDFPPLGSEAPQKRPSKAATKPAPAAPNKTRAWHTAQESSTDPASSAAAAWPAPGETAGYVTCPQPSRGPAWS